MGRFAFTGQEIQEANKFRLTKDVGEFLMEIINVSEKYNESSGFNNTWAQCRIVGPESKTSDLGIELMHCLPESPKAKGLVIDFIENAIGVKVTSDKEYPLDNDHLKGKRFWAAIKHSTYEGRAQNKMVSFRPVEKKTEPVAEVAEKK